MCGGGPREAAGLPAAVGCGGAGWGAPERGTLEVLAALAPSGPLLW